MYNVTIKVMPHKGLLDPQGKAVLGGLHNLQLSAINDVRVGKNITLQINASNAAEAKVIATTAAEKLLANAVMEYFEIHVEEA
jgi:phosphoribosylformylglycinamidine synthase subunit PurS